MKNKIVLLIFFIFFFSFGLEQVTGEEEYSRAKSAVKSGDQEFAFMHFLTVLKENPNSKHREEALFATAEYFFLISDYSDAFSELKEFIEDYPNSKIRTFALLYLLKISQIWREDQLARDIEKQIINSKRVVLLFKNTQEYKFKSPLGINYKLIYYIDRLEFYWDGKLQTQIYY
jgi:outer membrane protein assembly factor BamD (BamD/ComL family)